MMGKARSLRIRNPPIEAIAVVLIYGFLVSAAPAKAGEAKSSRQAQWDQTVRAAEKEGQVTVYISGYGAIIDSGAFQKAYPKIKVVSVTGQGTDLTARLAAERRAEKYIADVYSGGGNSLYQILYLGKMLDPIKPALVFPEVAESSNWWEGRHKFADKDGQHIFVYEGNVSSGGSPSYNTQLINAREFKSYWDFLDPKLKGKIVTTDLRKIRGAGIPWQFLYYHPELGPKFIRRFFSEMEPTLSAELRQAVDWLATGRFSLYIPSQGSGIVKAKNQGLPVDQFDNYQLKEGVNISSAFGSVALMNRAPHPNAAKLFINWLLSREGQTVFQRTMSMPGDARNSRRVDVSKDHIPPDEQRRDNMSYFDTDDPETKDLGPVIKLINEMVGGNK